jgi:hypothetical protein
VVVVVVVVVVAYVFRTKFIKMMIPQGYEFNEFAEGRIGYLKSTGTQVQQ